MSIATAAPTLPARVTLNDLAAELGVSKNTVSRWIREGRVPEPRQIGSKRFWIASDLVDLFGERE